MSLGIILPLVILPLAIIGVFVWYRRSIADLAPSESPPISGVRLTAEALHRVPSPPWRIVHEVAGALGEVDHIIVGPPGVIAIQTLMEDRPERASLLDAHSEAQLVSEAAVARGPVDELLRAIDASCDRTVTVFWGAPNSQRPAVEDLVHGSQLVEGQRLGQWLDSLSGDTSSPVDQSRIDAIWRTVVTGIGRPDPFA